MISNINIFIAVLWLASSIVDYNEYSYIWQLKEYRMDRFRDFLGTKTGQAYWRSYSILWRTLIVLVALLWPINSVPELKYLLILILSLDLIRNIFQFFRHKLRHPVFTNKAKVIILFCLAVEAGFFIFTKDWTLPFLLLIIRFFILSIVVQILSVPTYFLKQIYIKKAKEKLLAYSDIVVIGVTGSYGKSTVKHFLAQILGTDKVTIATPKNVNTEIGVAKFILSTKFDTVSYFVVEMGAYRMGEIQKICDLVKPKVGVLTGINEQHLSLFGSKENIKNAKFELIKSLPQDGFAVLNYNSPMVYQEAVNVEVEKQSYSSNPETSPNFLIESVSSKDGNLGINANYNNNSFVLSAPVVGAHNAENIAACYIVATWLGIKHQAIVKSINTLSTPEKTLKILKYGKTTILDDSYNANPDGFRSALDVFSGFSLDKKRIVITRGIPELGEISKSIHEQIGNAIANTADELVVITKDFEEPLRKGVGTKYNTKILLIEDTNDLQKYILSKKDTDSVILIENRIPELVYNEISKHTRD
jgi:UDP-N-acetylmuramoyl-tripeptide--D-alanyl-D-alanine ligase